MKPPRQARGGPGSVRTCAIPVIPSPQPRLKNGPASEQAQLGAQLRAQRGGRAGIGADGPTEGRAATEAQVSATLSAIRGAANDNAILRIAREIRHAVNGWRHGAAVDAFMVERTQVLAAWDRLRERVRAEGEAVALTSAFRETLDRHGALMKQVAMFSGKPQVFERLLAERAGIGQGEIEEFGQVHARAGSYMRSVKARAAHAARQDAERQDARAEKAGIAETVEVDTAASVAEVPAEMVREEHASPRPADTGATAIEADAAPDWRTLYSELQRDWNVLVAHADDTRAGEPDLPLLLMDGYDDLIQRVRALAEHPDISERARDVLDGLLEYHQDETVARETAEHYLAAAERHVEVYKDLERQAEKHGIPVSRLDAWPRW